MYSELTAEKSTSLMPIKPPTSPTPLPMAGLCRSHIHNASTSHRAIWCWCSTTFIPLDIFNKHYQWSIMCMKGPHILHMHLSEVSWSKPSKPVLQRKPPSPFPDTMLTKDYHYLDVQVTAFAGFWIFKPLSMFSLVLASVLHVYEIQNKCMFIASVWGSALRIYQPYIYSFYFLIAFGGLFPVFDY